MLWLLLLKSARASLPASARLTLSLLWLLLFRCRSPAFNLHVVACLHSSTACVSVAHAHLLNTATPVFVGVRHPCTDPLASSPASSLPCARHRTAHRHPTFACGSSPCQSCRRPRSTRQRRYLGFISFFFWFPSFSVEVPPYLSSPARLHTSAPTARRIRLCLLTCTCCFVFCHCRRCGPACLCFAYPAHALALGTDAAPVGCRRVSAS
jgi:hypothetical protein